MARNTKPKVEAESAEEDYSEGGEGGEGDAEDNRDVFEKALDWGPTAGTVLGGILGARVGSKAGAKMYKNHEQIQARIRRLEAKGRNPKQGLTPKERTLLEKSRADAEHVLGEYGGNMARRMFIQAPLGAVVGNMAGHAAQDVSPKRRK